jgi:cytochrome c553
MAAAACSAARGPAPVREQMVTHFDLATDLRRAALLGDLAAVRRSAALLADLERPRDLRPDQASRLGPLAQVAREAGRAQTVDEAARATARVAQACADCHVANGVGLGSLLEVGPLPTRRGVRGHMAELSRASELLWTGVAAPSDTLWEAGATALTAAGPLPTGLAQELPATYVYDAGLRLRRLGQDAATAAGAVERDRLLGEIWATCSDCHARVGIR